MKTICINLFYKDRANFKSNGEDYFTNSTNIPFSEIEKKLAPFIDGDPIMVQDYHISSIAPVENEFLPNTTEYDHPYCEITGVEEQEWKEGGNTPMKDIQSVMQAIDEGGAKEYIAQRKAAAIQECRERIAELQEGEKQPYKSFELSPVWKVEGGFGTDLGYEVMSEEDLKNHTPHYYSIYGRNQENLAEWLADFEADAKENAETLCNLLNNLLNSRA